MMRPGKLILIATLLPSLAMAHGPHSVVGTGFFEHLLAHAWPIAPLIVMAGFYGVVKLRARS